MDNGKSYCSFCGIDRTSTRFMADGPDVSICGSCVALAVTQMAEGKAFMRQIDATFGVDDTSMILGEAQP